MFPRSLARGLAALGATAAVLACAPALAQTSVYGGIGLTGVTLGLGHSYGDAFGARAEVSAWPSISRDFSEDNVDYRGDLKMRRATALADWRPFRGTFRLTAGLSAVSARGDFTGSPANGTTFEIGGANVAVGPADRFDARIELPSVMPYLGLGWGHSPARGWGFHSDVGVLIGEPKVSGTLSASLRAKIAAAGFDPDVELERELRSVRDGVAKIDAIPYVSVGVSYRW